MTSLARQLREKEALKGVKGRARSSWARRRVLDRLNAQPNSESAKRVLWLLQALREAESLRLQLYDAYSRSVENVFTTPSRQVQDEQDFRVSFADPQLQATNLKFRKLVTQIDKKLKRYRWTPDIQCDWFSGFQQAYIWTRRSEQNHWENLAVEYLLGRTTYGSVGRSPSEILRVRQCRHCQKWFYATTEHQTSCSGRCRKQFHSESPEAHLKRAEYMRDYRKREQERNRRALARINKRRLVQ